MKINKRKNENIRNKFCSDYYNKLLPLFLSMESIRRKYLWETFWTTVFVIFFPIIFVILPIVFRYHFDGYEIFSVYGNYYFVNLIFGAMFPVGVVFSPILYICFFTGESYLEIKKKFQKELKEHCLQDVLKSFGNIKPSVFTEKDISLIAKSGLDFYFSNTNRASHSSKIECDDCMSGEYKGVKFKLMELSNGYYSWGRLIISFSSNKTIKCPAIITQKGQTPKSSTDKKVSRLAFIFSAEIIAAIFVWNWLYRAYQDFLTYEGDIGYLCKFSALLVLLALPLICFIIYTVKKIIHAWVTSKNEKVKLEDGQFEVASEDDVEARYLITPTFLERLKNLQKVYGKKSSIKCAFFEDQIMFAIRTKKDFFELGTLWAPMSDTKQIEEFYSEMTAIYDMIDYFKLNEKTRL